MSVSRYAQEELNKFDRGAINDAKQKLYNLFKSIYGLDNYTDIERQVFHFISDPASRDSLLDSLEKVILGRNGKQREDIDFIFFYYCGHGQKDRDNNKLILPMTDSLPGRELSSDDLFKSLAKAARAKIFIILDCCYSGSVQPPQGHNNFCILASSMPDQRSHKKNTYPALSELLIDYFSSLKGKNKNVKVGDLIDYVIGDGNYYIFEDGNGRTQKGDRISRGTVEPVNLFSMIDTKNTNQINSEAPLPEPVPEKNLCRDIQEKETNYIFLFGETGVGKTAITSSLIYHLDTQTDEGTLYPIEHSFKKAEFHNHIRHKFGKGVFLERSRIEILDVGFKYKSIKKEVRLNFLEMNGENFNQIERGGAGKYDEGVEKFLRCPGISIIFFLVVDYKTASEKDLYFSNFLEYLEDISPKGKGSRKQKFLLLISKWDEYKGRYSAEDFVKEKMPSTFSKLSYVEATIFSYSVGTVWNKRLIDINKDYPLKVKNWLFNEIAPLSLRDIIWKTLKEFLIKAFGRYD